MTIVLSFNFKIERITQKVKVAEPFFKKLSFLKLQNLHTQKRKNRQNNIFLCFIKALVTEQEPFSRKRFTLKTWSFTTFYNLLTVKTLSLIYTDPRFEQNSQTHVLDLWGCRFFLLGWRCFTSSQWHSLFCEHLLGYTLWTAHQTLVSPLAWTSTSVEREGEALLWGGKQELE